MSEDDRCTAINQDTAHRCELEKNHIGKHTFGPLGDFFQERWNSISEGKLKERLIEIYEHEEGASNISELLVEAKQDFEEWLNKQPPTITVQNRFDGELQRQAWDNWRNKGLESFKKWFGGRN